METLFNRKTRVYYVKRDTLANGEFGLAICSKDVKCMEDVITLVHSDEFNLEHQGRFPHPFTQITDMIIDGVLIYTKQKSRVSY